MDLTGQVSGVATPVVFGPVDAWCFGWFHPAHAPSRKVGVVLCRPMGYEATCTYPTYAQLAENLATAGFDVLRFDYHGTGDSAGSDADPDRVCGWIDSIALAINELKRLGDISSISLLGVRLGATLAAHAAMKLGGIDSLVMWAPCLTGRAFARELRAANASHSSVEGDAASEDIEALGYLYTAETLQGLSTLDCQRLDAPPAKRVMIIGRDDMPAGEGPLPPKYRDMGIDVTYTVLPGYAEMMLEPLEGRVELTTLGLIVDWLSTAPQTQAAKLGIATTRTSPRVDSVYDGIREIPLKFGREQSLFGILAEPVESSTRSRSPETAILMLNVGGHYRIGPSRIYVRMARSLAASGYSALRLDVSGFGDSRAGADISNGDLYSRDCTADVQAAIDCLAAKGCKRFVLTGICSGSYLAFQTALIDSRVKGQILINPLRLEQQTGENGDSKPDTMQASYKYKPTRHYLRSLLNPEVYPRLFRGDIDVGWIAGKFRTVIDIEAKRTFRWLLRAIQNREDLLTKVRRLTARGTDTLVIVAAEDNARNFIEFHLGKRGNQMRGVDNFQMAVVEGADHTLSDSKSQKSVIDIVQQHLEKTI